MLELPESTIIARQLNETALGKTISNVVANYSPQWSGKPDPSAVQLFKSHLIWVVQFTGVLSVSLLMSNG